MIGESKAKALLFVVAAVIIVVVVIYGIFSGRGVEVDIPGGPSVKLIEKKSEAGGAHREVSGPTITESESPQEKGYALNVPGRGLLPFSKVDAFYIDPPANDPQDLHKGLVLEMLAGRKLEQLYKESDDAGVFSTWLTSGTLQDGKRCFDYTTLYERWSGRVEVGMRVACPSGDGWTWEISPELRELVQGTNDSQVAPSSSKGGSAQTLGSGLLNLPRSTESAGTASHGEGGVALNTQEANPPIYQPPTEPGSTSSLPEGVLKVAWSDGTNKLMSIANSLSPQERQALILNLMMTGQDTYAARVRLSNVGNVRVQCFPENIHIHIGGNQLGVITVSDPRFLQRGIIPPNSYFEGLVPFRAPVDQGLMFRTGNARLSYDDSTIQVIY